MSAVAEMTRQPTLAGLRLDERWEQSSFEPGGLSLEDAILEVWDDLASKGHAECPVCGGSMLPIAGCETCGSELS